MIQLTINAETEAVSNAFKTFTNSQRETIAGFLNTIVSEDGSPSDAMIEVKETEINIFQFAPDKGFILVENKEEDADLPVRLERYINIEDGDKFLLHQKEFVNVCIKTKDGEPDAVLGRFKNQNDAIKNFNAPEVKEAFKNWSEKTAAQAKRAEKQAAKVARLGLNKGDEDSSQPVEAEPQADMQLAPIQEGV